MYLDDLPSVRITDMRRSGALRSDMGRVAVTLQGQDDALVSIEVGVAAFVCVQAASSCNSSADFADGALRSFACMLVASYAGAALAFATGVRASLRCAAPCKGLSGSRRHGSIGGPVSRRPGRTMERRASSWRRYVDVRPWCVGISQGVYSPGSKQSWDRRRCRDTRLLKSLRVVKISRSLAKRVLAESLGNIERAGDGLGVPSP